MSSCVAELDTILQSMLALKAPGVTGGKVNSITALCNANIQVRTHNIYLCSVLLHSHGQLLIHCDTAQSETVLIQRVYTHFKKAPVTHKLGVLYVVDSVTRGWVEQARKAGQTVGPSAPDGTFAAGVNRVTELLPSFMSDIITNAPEEQKVRLLESIAEARHQMAGFHIGTPILALDRLVETPPPVYCISPNSRMCFS